MGLWASNELVNMCKKTGQQLSECKTLFPHFVDEEHEDQEGNSLWKNKVTLDNGRGSSVANLFLIAHTFRWNREETHLGSVLDTVLITTYTFSMISSEKENESSEKQIICPGLRSWWDLDLCLYNNENPMLIPL